MSSSNTCASPRSRPTPRTTPRCAAAPTGSKGKLKEAGLTTRQIDNGGKPLVYAEWLGAPGKKTLLFYGHYDVQPADPLELWNSPPFEPVFAEDGKVLVARGATDDKGQSFTHVKAVAAMLAERGKLPVNVKFIIEGEEESGGQAIEKYVRERRRRRARLRRHPGLRLLDVPARPAVADLRPQGPLLPRAAGLRAESGPAFRQLRRRGAESRQRPRLDRRLAAQPADRAHPDPRLLRPGAAAGGVGAPGVRLARV